MARGKSSDGATVQLFPFLAVLVCVMGSLIFLLLATTKRMHDIAVAEAQANWQAEQSPPDVAAAPLAPDPPRVDIPASSLGDPTESVATNLPVNPPGELAAEPIEETKELEARLADLLKRRHELQGALRRQHALQTAAQGKIEALQATVGESQTRLRGVLAQIASFKEDLSAEQDLTALEQQIIELRQKLRALQNRQTVGQTKFAVVPFDVRSGTTRRPILIECTDFGLRFLPEDVVITPQDLEGFTEQYNPLLAGARALMSYWTAWNMRQSHPDDKPEPYVLLMVRPNGTVGYYVAMRMLSSLKQPHGYELIDESIELQPPPLDPEARRICREAVERQLAERAAVAKEARNGFRSGNASDGSTTAARGGKSRPKTSNKFEVSDVLPSAEEGVSERSWENIERFEGRRSGGSHESRVKSQEPAVGNPKRPGAGRSATASSPSAEGQPRELPETLTAENSGATRIQRSTARTPSQSTEEPDAADEDLPPSQTGDRPRPPGSANRMNGQRTPNSRRPGMTTTANGRRQRGDSTDGPQAHLAQLGRRHWGDSEPHANIGIEQDVTIRVDAEQMVVADNHVVRYHPGEQSLDLFLRLMEAVDAEANTWGKPRPGFYWTPRLRFVVSPGGNHVFERIDPLTIRSGLSTTREFTLERAAIEKK